MQKTNNIKELERQKLIWWEKAGKVVNSDSYKNHLKFKAACLQAVIEEKRSPNKGSFFSNPKFSREGFFKKYS